MVPEAREDQRMTCATAGEFMELVGEALDSVIDPCSVGRGLHAGLRDMGMVGSIELGSFTGSLPGSVIVTLQTTSPACTFQTWFDDRVKQEVAQRLPGVACDVRWSTAFDWSDDSMSDALKARIREKRERVLLTLGRVPA